MKKFSFLYIALILAFLFAPIAVLIVFSFNSGNSVFVFESFSFDFKWYRVAPQNPREHRARRRTNLPFLQLGLAPVSLRHAPIMKRKQR